MTAEETLYIGTVTNIAALIEACDFPPETFVLVERAPRVVIDDVQERRDLLRFALLSDGVDIASYTSGRVFNPDFELRWEQDALTVGKTSVVYIGTERNLPGLTKSKYTLQTEKEEPQYYLFGERLDEDKLNKMAIEPREGYYAETRVPRLLLYPTIKRGKSPDRLQLIAREYRLIVSDREQEREEGRTYRFVKLVTPKEEKQA
jgi:hypothetical protein